MTPGACRRNAGIGQHPRENVAIEHALRNAAITPEPELVAAVLAEVKRIREERAERSDFSSFHRQYYAHLNQMGLTADDVVDIAKALTTQRTS